jgi:hypothetical protein
MAEDDNVVGKVGDFKFAWDGGAAAMGLLILTTYAGVKLGIEMIRAKTQIKVAEINNGRSS